MSINIPDPEVECWDYSLNLRVADRLWLARPKDSDDPAHIVTISINPLWRYAVVSDSAEQLKSDLDNMTDDEPFEWEIYSTSVADVLGSWRLLRFNGRNVCVTECLDSTPINPEAWPGGPMAPVRNGWAYICVDKSDGSPVHVTISNKDKSIRLPVVEPTINKLLNRLCDEGEAYISPEKLFSKYWVVAINLLELAMTHPVVCWSDKVLPIYGIMGLNPNHSGDPEEIALATLDSQAEA